MEVWNEKLFEIDQSYFFFHPMRKIVFKTDVIIIDAVSNFVINEE